MSQRPTLQVAVHPLRVFGSGFRGGERVTVLANMPPRMESRRAVASSDGTFVVSFADVEGVPRGLNVRASGSEGSAALYAPRAARVSPPSAR